MSDGKDIASEWFEIDVTIEGDYDYSTDYGVECTLTSCTYNGHEIIGQLNAEEKAILQEDCIFLSGQKAQKEYAG